MAAVSDEEAERLVALWTVRTYLRTFRVRAISERRGLSAPRPQNEPAPGVVPAHLTHSVSEADCGIDSGKAGGGTDGGGVDAAADGGGADPATAPWRRFLRRG